MAHYNITNLNCMTSGGQRGLVNIDYRLADTGGNHLHMAATDDGLSAIVTETGKVEWKKTDYIKQLNDPGNPALALQDSVRSAVLNEYQPYALSAEEYPKQELRLFLECDEKKLCADSAAFNESHNFKNQTFQFEKIRSDNTETWAESDDRRQFAPMYDLMDLCIKSSVKKLRKNDVIGTDENVDQYMALDSQPIQICQTDTGNAFVLTEPTSKQDYILNSSIRKNRYQIDEEFTMSPVQQNDKVCLYRPVDELSPAAGSIGEHLAKTGQTNAKNMEYFEPKYLLNGIEYNKLVEIDQNSGKNPTVYGDGDTYGDFILAKNHLNSQYSMDMNSVSELENCRRYCGAHKSNKYIVMKYYDNVGYTANTDVRNTDSCQNVGMQKLPAGQKLPYQKVEFLQHVNHSAEGQRTFHKSNLFSIRIGNTGLNNASPASNEKVSKIKTDIKRMVRQIAENICPANTQLFDVYIDD